MHLVIQEVIQYVLFFSLIIFLEYLVELVSYIKLHGEHFNICTCDVREGLHSPDCDFRTCWLFSHTRSELAVRQWFVQPFYPLSLCNIHQRSTS